MPPRHSKRALASAATLTSSPPDELEPEHSICRVIKAAGNNLYSLETVKNETILAELPAKFRNAIWLRRGGYVVVDHGTFEGRGGKVSGEIVNVVRDEKEWRKKSYWPEQFVKRQLIDSDDEDEEESNMGKMPPSDSEGEEEENDQPAK
ncbi:putative eukaryotic translation initiation factor eIF1 [Ascobolus immersus RN42]|uniref:Putative eukaryotic translation initiation factor eIF1 n=1 Tax=Ascobolus immersus RN42 TaxID=1160509 RepID=A0A3N4I3B7_ASCIM|nr:putative eukaryotic translation initiation factor eIF1 [Ascobolus immersus RN42]